MIIRLSQKLCTKIKVGSLTTILLDDIGEDCSWVRLRVCPIRALLLASHRSRICRMCREMAFFRNQEIPTRAMRVSDERARSLNERVTFVALSSRLNSHVSSKLVARRDSGGEKSFISNVNR